MLRAVVPLGFLLVLQLCGSDGQNFFQTVREGDDITLSCEDVLPDQNECQFTNWSIGDYPHFTALFIHGKKATAVNSSASLLQNCSMVLHRVTVELAGEYFTCQQSEDEEGISEILLFVASLSQEQKEDRVNLTCSVAPEPCSHKVKWLNNGEEVTKDHPELQMSRSRSGCSASLSFKDPSPPSPFYHTLKCEVRKRFPDEIFTLFPRAPPEDKTTTAATVGSSAATVGSSAATVGSSAATVGSSAATVGSSAATVGSSAATVGSSAATVGSSAATVGSSAATVGSSAATVGSSAATVGSSAATVGSSAATVGSSAATVGSSAVTVGSSAATVGSSAATVGSAAVTVGSAAATVGSSAATVGSSAATVGSSAATVGSSAATVGSSAATVGSSAATVGSSAATVGSSAATVGSSAASPSTGRGLDGGDATSGHLIRDVVIVGLVMLLLSVAVGYLYVKVKGGGAFGSNCINVNRGGAVAYENMEEPSVSII